MTQITLDISDSQLKFFLELIKNFDFVKIEDNPSENKLSPNQISILNERIEDYEKNPDSYLDLQEVKKKLSTKYDI